MGEVGVHGNRRSNRDGRDDPFERIVAIDMKRASENVFLIESNIQKQPTEKRLGTLGISGIENAIAAVESAGLRAGLLRSICSLGNLWQVAFELGG